jgi:hypothetical protein
MILMRLMHEVKSASDQLVINGRKIAPADGEEGIEFLLLGCGRCPGPGSFEGSQNASSLPIIGNFHSSPDHVI